MTKKKFFSPEHKVAIMRKQSLKNVPVSDLYDQYGIHPSVFYRWEKAFFGKGHLTFHQEKDTGASKLEKKVSK